MRILFTAYPLHGHINPMLPLARAVVDAGHDVAFATGADMAAHVAAHGLPHWEAGPTHAQTAATVPPSPRWFEVSAEPRLADLVPSASSWRPDLVVADEFDLAGPVLGRVVGVPFVVHGLGVMLPTPIWTGLTAEVARLHGLWGFPDGTEAVRAAVYLERVPAVLRPPGPRVWSRTQPLRPVPAGRGTDDQLPEAMAALPHERTIHLTLGTLFHTRTAVLQTAIAGLRALPCNLVVTCGPGSDPARFGPQPEHVLIAPYIDHAALLPRCHLVVSQGGAGIMLGALASDLPQLMVPQGADQFINAELCTTAGAALALAPGDFTSEAVATAARQLLRDAEYQTAARALGTAIRAMPEAGDVLASLLAGLQDPAAAPGHGHPRPS